MRIKERTTKKSLPLCLYKQPTHNTISTQSAATVLQGATETTRPKVSNTEATQHRGHMDRSGDMMRRLPQANKARPGPAQWPGSPRGHRREHKALGELLLPRYPSKGFPIIDPLPLPFFTLEPLFVESVDLELVEMIRGRRRVDRRHEPRNLATYSRCRFISPRCDRDAGGRNGDLRTVCGGLGGRGLVMTFW